MRKNQIFLAMLILTGLILSSGCQTNEEIIYDIRGTWIFYFSNVSETSTVTFTGTVDSGTLATVEGTTGTYTVNGKNAAISADRTEVYGNQKWEFHWEFTGTFIDTRNMSGAVTLWARYYLDNILTDESIIDTTWTATK